MDRTHDTLSVSCCAAKFNVSSFAANWGQLVAATLANVSLTPHSTMNEGKPEMTGLSLEIANRRL